MKKQLLMTQELYNANIAINPLFKPELFAVGATTPICNKKPKNSIALLDEGEKNCCEENCPPAPVGYHYVCSLCNCVAVPNTEG